MMESNKHPFAKYACSIDSKLTLKLSEEEIKEKEQEFERIKNLLTNRTMEITKQDNKNGTMINLHDCRFGDRLVTKGGTMVVYLGYSKPINTEPLEQEGYHAIAGEHGEWFYFSKYYDDGTIFDNNGKMCGAGDPLNIAGLYKGNGIDLSNFKFGDRLKTICGAPAVFLGYSEATGNYEISVLSDRTGKHETIFCEKDGIPNHESLFRYRIIGKQD